MNVIVGENARFVLHGEYLEIAWLNLCQAREASQKQKTSPRFKVDSTLPEHIRNKSGYIYHSSIEGYASITAVVFSALALEAYINDLARVSLPTFHRDSMDCMDLPAKWVLIPRVAFAKGLEPGDHIIGRITALQKQRNQLVHARPFFLSGDMPAESLHRFDVRVADAEQAVQTCLDAIGSLEERCGGNHHAEFEEWRNRWMRWEQAAIELQNAEQQESIELG